jgi:predicted phage terminase large subunit-like protein
MARAKTKATPELKAIFAREIARRSLGAYAALAHRGLWVPGRLHKFLCDTVQDFVEEDTGHPYDVLGLSVPPQHGKSQSVTEVLPSWYLGRHPDRKVIEISYNDDFAAYFGRRNRQHITDFGPFVFGIHLGANASEHSFELAGRKGRMISCGLGGGITGNAADLIVMDDPIKSRLEADSEVYRARLWDLWQNSVKSRLSAGGKVILIQTRWHEDDLYGKLEKTEEFFRKINIPCEAEENDLLGRAPGEALAPEIGKGEAWLAAFKASYKDGMRAWNALYQGRPSSQEGNILLRRWWRLYKESTEEKEAFCDNVILSVDCAFKDSEDGSRVAIQCWGQKYANSYLLDAVARPMGFSDTIKEILLMKRTHPRASLILIEEKANGAAVIETLRKYFPGVVGVTPKGGKVARAYAVQGSLESGNVYLPEASDFADDFMEECASFPYGTFDDQVDAFTQAQNKLITFASKLPEDTDPLFPYRVEGEAPKSGALGKEKIDVV